MFVLKVCRKDCPGLGNRSIFYPHSPYIAQNVVPSHLASLTGYGFESHFELFFKVTLTRASLKKHLPGSPGIETKLAGPRTAVDDTDAPKRSKFGGGARGRGSSKDYPRLGNPSAFYPHSSVGNTFASLGG